MVPVPYMEQGWPKLATSWPEVGLPGASLVPPWCLPAPIDLVPGFIFDPVVRNLSLPRSVLDPKVCNLSHLRTNLHQLWTNLSQLKMNFGQLRINLSLLWAIPAPYKAQEPLKTNVSHWFLYVFQMSALHAILKPSAPTLPQFGVNFGRLCH